MAKTYPKSLMMATVAMSLWLTEACSNAGKSDSASNASPSPSSASGPVLGADVQKLSRIIITPRSEWSELKGFVLGKSNPSSLVAALDQPGKLAFTNLFPGNYDLILEAKERGVDGKIAPVALTISGIAIVEGQDVQIRDVELKPYIKLEGKVLFGDKESSVDSHAGILVQISGTPYHAATTADGSFQFAELPQGNHYFEILAPGYNPASIAKKPYRGDEKLSPVSLIRDSYRLENGVHYLGAPLKAGASRHVTLQLAAPQGMTHFRYSFGPESLESKVWINLQSSYEFDLPSEGEPKVNVQYSVAERQLSPVFSAILPTE